VRDDHRNCFLAGNTNFLDISGNKPATAPQELLHGAQRGLRRQARAVWPAIGTRNRGCKLVAQIDGYRNLYFFTARRTANSFQLQGQAGQGKFACLAQLNDAYLLVIQGRPQLDEHCRFYVPDNLLGRAGMIGQDMDLGNVLVFTHNLRRENSLYLRDHRFDFPGAKPGFARNEMPSSTMRILHFSTSYDKTFINILLFYSTSKAFFLFLSTPVDLKFEKFFRTWRN
jgi:hypothetical protein